MTDPERSKQTVIAYLDTAFNDKQPAEAVENYGGSHYIQHNPQAPDGFEAFIQFVEGFVEQFPQLSLDIKRAIAEGVAHPAASPVTALTTAMIQKRAIPRHSPKCPEGRRSELRLDGVLGRRASYTQRRTLAL